MKVIEVSQKEMKRRTGFGKALGYAFPDKGEVLVRDDLTPKKRKEVLAHEEDHMEKGEEGPFLDFIADIFGASKQASAAKDATRAQEQASREAIEFQRESRDLARGDQAPYREAGYTALDALMSMTGLAAPAQPQPAPAQNANNIDFDASVFEAIRRRYNPNSQGYIDATRGRGRFPGQFWQSRAEGGDLMEGEYYVVNEEGPEDRFQNGKVFRNAQPTYMQPGEGGYVKPTGRMMGGMMRNNIMYNPSENQNPYNQGAATVNPSEKERNVIMYNQDGSVAENPGGVEGGFNFKADPGYNFRLGEGMRVLERGAAARGGLLSGGFARKAIRYGQDYASNEYGNVYNRIANIAGLGQVSANSSGNAALTAGSNMGNAALYGGDARASGYTAQGNIWGDAIRSGGDFLQDLDLFGNKKSGGGGTSVPRAGF